MVEHLTSLEGPDFFLAIAKRPVDVGAAPRAVKLRSVYLAQRARTRSRARQGRWLEGFI